MFVRVLVFAIAALSGCGGEDHAGVPDAGRSDGGGGGSCTVMPDTTCPDEAPAEDGPCEGALSCDYDLPGEITATYTCTSGAWVSGPLCPGCAPPLAERCRTPFTGSLSSGVALAGPDGGFSPFTGGDRVLPVFGGQGAAMIAYRVALDADDAPDCVTLRTEVTLDGTSDGPSEITIRLHCGESRRIFAILPLGPCEFHDYPAALDVEVVGAGSSAVDLVLEGGSCPR